MFTTVTVGNFSNAARWNAPTCGSAIRTPPSKDDRQSGKRRRIEHEGAGRHEPLLLPFMDRHDARTECLPARLHLNRVPELDPQSAWPFPSCTDTTGARIRREPIFLPPRAFDHAEHNRAAAPSHIDLPPYRLRVPVSGSPLMLTSRAATRGTNSAHPARRLDARSDPSTVPPALASRRPETRSEYPAARYR